MDLATFRLEKDRFMKTHAQSPLPSEQRRTFTGLDYYPENPDLCFDVTITPDPEQPIEDIATSTGDIRSFQRAGSFQFTVKGEQYRLYVYYDPQGDYEYIPFTDQTTGKETYGAGRYIEPERLPDGKYRIDFNRAYNPFCAYSPSWSCPIPPRENHVDVRIEAGEKEYRVPSTEC
jgi:uncharacterized protein